MKSRLNAFIEKNKHAFLLLYFCIYFPWFHHLERTVTTHFHVIHTALDDLIPFCEYFIVPYLLWFGYVAWAVGYFYFKNKDEYFKLCAMLFTGMTVFLVISTIYPNGHYLRPAYFEHNNIFIQLSNGCTQRIPRRICFRVSMCSTPLRSILRCGIVIISKKIKLSAIVPQF